MPGKPFRFVIAFEGNLDSVPGAWHSEADFQQLVTHDFLRISQYNASVTILESTDAYDTMGGYKSNAEGWIEVEGQDMPEGLSPDTEIQVRTRTVTNCMQWFPAGSWWVEDRKAFPDAQITHYRPRKPADGNADADAGSHYAFSEQG